MKQSFLVLLQLLIPHHLLSRIVHRAMRARKFPMRDHVTRWLEKKYNVNASEAVEPDFTNHEYYPTLNSCFTRELRPGVRQISEQPLDIVSPVDGTVSQIGAINKSDIFQAKGRNYSLFELMAGCEKYTDTFINGSFATIYLSPRDYHRVHMPLDGKLINMTHVPGRLFSVSPNNIATIPKLFARNERVINIFETPNGPMAVIMVGAIFVGSIETVWAGEVTPPRGKKIIATDYQASGGNAVSLQRGEEMGRFNMGSTVILLFPPGASEWNANVQVDNAVLLGQKIGDIKKKI